MSAAALAADVAAIQQRFGIVGRDRELAAALACVRAGCDLLIEGPVGVGKTVLAHAVARFLNRPFFRVDGDERYTEQKLTGWFDPPVVMRSGYTQEAFTPGPLVEAMQAGGLLFINELNRMPEGAQNVLLPALDEDLLIVPRIGAVRARPGFAVLATQNPQEFVATSHLSEALRDRFELLRIDYQSHTEEVAIVRLAVPEAPLELAEAAVRLTRATRSDPALKRGASVRAAIAMCQIALQLGGMRALPEAALLALPTRVELREDAKASLEEVIRALVEGEAKKA